MSERIAILGTGSMGAGLAAALSRGGFEVLLGSRDVARAAAVAQRIQPAAGAAIRPAGYEEAAAAATVVIPALGFGDMLGLLPALGALLAGKIVVDVSTPWAEEIEERSAAERLAALLPADAELVGAWKTTYAALLDPAARADTLHDTLICGESAPAKRRVAALVAATGFRPLDCGGLLAARVVEGMVRLMNPIAARLAPGAPPAWKFLP